jgi:cell division protein FtsW
MTALRTNLFVVALTLSLLGNVMVYSATSKEYGTHYLVVRFAHLAVGVLSFLLVKQVRYTSWRKIAPGFYLLVLASLLLVLIPGIGIEVRGARRWLDVGPASLQPAEFAKLAAVLLLSCAVARLRSGSGLPVRPVLAVSLLFGLVLVEPDFGTSVVIAVAAAGVLWASELRTRVLLLFGTAASASLVGMMLLAPYRRNRFLAFLDPWSVSEGSGYQIVQSMVIGAFAFLTLAGLKIALNAPSVMGRCLAAGLATMFAVQTIFNIGAAMGTVPLAGMTLPFVSYGGSSVFVCFAAIGILYRVSEDGEKAREAKPRKVSTRGGARPDARFDRRWRNGRTRDPRALRGG